MAAASLAGRRWGHAVSGWLVGFPLTSGPVTLFLALEQGPAFAASAALGSMAGVLGAAAFGVVYAAAARRGVGLVPSLAAGAIAFAAVGALLQGIALPAVALTALILVTLVVSIRLVPDPGAAARVALPRWDLPARMIVATVLVLGITSGADVLGARLSGLLATIPLYASILASFGHALVGPAAGIRVWRGLFFGLFGFAGFYLAVTIAIEPLGIVPAFALAIVTSLAVQGATLMLVRREPENVPA